MAPRIASPMSTSISRCSRLRFRAARGNNPTPPITTARAYPAMASRFAVDSGKPNAGPSHEKAIPSASASSGAGRQDPSLGSRPPGGLRSRSLGLPLDGRMHPGPLHDQPGQPPGIDDTRDVIHRHRPVDQVEPQSGDPFLIAQRPRSASTSFGQSRPRTWSMHTGLAHRTILFARLHPVRIPDPGTDDPTGDSGI